MSLMILLLVLLCVIYILENVFSYLISQVIKKNDFEIDFL